MALTDNLVSYWKLDESSGNAADAHGSNTLTNNNTVTYVAAKINNGASLVKASNQYFTAANGAIFGTGSGNNFSISMWYKTTSITQYDTLFKTGNEAVNEAFIIGFDSNSAYYVDTWTTAYAPTATINNGTFYHVVLTADGTNFKLYHNGSLINTTALNPNFVSASTYVGRTGTGTYIRNFDGVIDEIGIWSRALTSTEVTSLYNSGSGLAYPFASAVNSNFLAFM